LTSTLEAAMRKVLLYSKLYDELCSELKAAEVVENVIDLNKLGVERARKVRVRWSSSPCSNVKGYRLYWSVNGGVSYDSSFAEIGNVTQVILPDDLPLFPDVKDGIELGLTVVTHTGDESDMVKLSVPPEFP
jgi:hypothetical protein